MSKHTPGPWWTDAKYDGKEMGCSIIAARTDSGPLPGNPTRGQVAFATAILNTQARECEANAKLIAAAPELLELAKRLASECADCDGRGFVYGDDGVTGRGPDDVEPTRIACAECDDIRAVIAKATSHS